MPANQKAFDLMGDDIVEFSTENEALKNQTGECYEKWLEKSKAKLLKLIDDEETANLTMSRRQKQLKKQ